MKEREEKDDDDNNDDEKEEDYKSCGQLVRIVIKGKVSALQCCM